MTGWSIEIEVRGITVLADDAIDVLVDELSAYAGVIAIHDDGYAARVSVDADTVDAAVADAREVVRAAATKTSVPDEPVVRLEALTEASLEAELAEPVIPQLLGVAEVAERLGVSRQRISELRRSQYFPDPVADLRAGPVWAEPTLLRFIETWTRSPGQRYPEINEGEEAEVASQSRHVVPNPAGGWDVKQPGADRASSHHDTQSDAEARAKEILSRSGGGEAVIHSRDGSIRDSDTVAPARDPFPPRDRRH